MGEIRFVGTGETRGYPYLVCKKFPSMLPLYEHKQNTIELAVVDGTETIKIICARLCQNLS